jgi:energy-coupling factor transport system permease protein
MAHSVNDNSSFRPVQRDAFGSCHPVVNLLFFIQVIGISMLEMHPVLLVISFLTAFRYVCCLYQKSERKPLLRFFLPAALMLVLINALFHHRGVTVLMMLPSGNALTLESIMYGFAAALMMLAVTLWFACLNAVMPPDKFVYLFGRVIPVLALILSMTLRFVPMMYSQFRQIEQVQRSMGHDVTKGPVLQRMRSAAAIVSILLTWAMENAVVTADSMKGRGYGLPGRTAFSIYRFDKRDGVIAAGFTICAIYTAVLAAAGYLDWTFYPVLSGSLFHPLAISGYAAYTALCVTPLVLNKREDRVWDACR